MLAPSSSPRPRSLDDLLPPGLAARLDRLDLLSRRVFSGKLPGERRSRRRGSSVEFDDYRDYLPGDDLRRLDWNVLARLDRVLIKLFREDEDQALHLVLDASASMDAGNPSKLVAALRLALALGYVGLANQSRVLASVLSAPGRPALQALAPIRGKSSLQRLASFLLSASFPSDNPSTHPPGSFTRSLRDLVASRRAPGILVLCSDLLLPEDPIPPLNILAAGPFDAHCFQVLSLGELDPESEPALLGDLSMTDAETGRSAEVTVTRSLIRRYRQRLDAHVDSIRRACLARGISHALVRADADPFAILTDQLRRGRLVG